ncbi:MAG: pyruvate kinase alpha/beta domain-containing protein [Candidatus Heimdallarchaeaceae archaeon]
MGVYFNSAGDYTEQVLKIVQDFLKTQDEIKEVVIATTTGKTAIEFARKISNAQIVAVSHQAGFRERGQMEISAEKIELLKSLGAKIVTATHAFAGVDRAIRKQLGTWAISELIAQTLRIFGQGTKVCAEIALMAADAGLLSMEDIIAVGGTNTGADTAWIISPAHTHNFFDLKMKRLLCKPLEF